jgi:formylglycine-generating enzyme required for sulfatase activity
MLHQSRFDALNPEMVTVPAGPFLMGSDPREIRQLSRTARGSRSEWYKREQPSHSHNIPAYAIGRFPVTVQEFADFMEDGGYRHQELWSAQGWQWRVDYQITAPEFWHDPNWTRNPHLPIVGISWYTASAYTNWLAAHNGVPFRLPTESEWEKAARSSDGRRYPWGNRWEPAYCNVAQQSIDTWDAPAEQNDSTLNAVGQFSPQGDSPFGCADMAGNIWEWCQSPLRRYPLNAEHRSEADSTEQQIVRGGSWYHGPDDARCAARYCYFPQGRDNVVGFRLALSI